MKAEDIVIVAAKRTPQGNMQGVLSSLTSPELASYTHQAAIKQATIKPEEVDEVIIGCVLQAGIGQAPARQSAKMAGIPDSIGATTINKMCGSGMKSIMLAHDLIKAGSAEVVLAGGMESMSNAPYLLQKARGGYRLGHGALKDSMFLDGLEDAYDKGQLMGLYADKTAEDFAISRQMQDNFAKLSLDKALKAQKNGDFDREIVPIKATVGKVELTITQDEGPNEKNLGKIDGLKPAFSKEGTVTVASSSKISDGASSLILMSYAKAQQMGVTPIAKVHAHATHSNIPSLFTTAPIDAIKKVIKKAHWSLDEVELFEINEAFAVVTLIATKELIIPHEKVNVHGGACALGHPIGASGARIATTLIYALLKHGLKKGVASLCIGGGEATAMAIEVL